MEYNIEFQEKEQPLRKIVFETYKNIVSKKGIKCLTDEELSSFFNEIMYHFSIYKYDLEKYLEAEKLYYIASDEIFTRYRV